MKLTTTSIALILALSSGIALAEEEKKEEDKDKKDKEKQTIASIIKDKKHTKGLLNFYQDNKTGKHILLLEESQLNTPILYFAHTVDGLADAGHFRGAYRETKVIEFRQHFDRIDIITKTPHFIFDDNNPISRAKEANISEAVLASLKIKKQQEGQIALEVDKLFLSEALHKVSPWARANDKHAKKRFKPGKVDSKKSRILHKRAYDNNIDIVVDYVFNNPNPSIYGSRAVSDPRSTSVKVQHSFVALPTNNFTPRYDDARIGYFTEERTNMTSNQWAPYQDMINRWNLVKKDPTAKLSEPVEPIVWWIENTTPHPWRETISQAVLSWNSSFEKAGFKNAIQVKIQPDDATWDAGDINYNVLRWTASPTPFFGGYGPSLANPLTGQLIGADIMLELIFMKNRWIYDSLYTQGASSLHSNDQPTNHLTCSAGHQLQQGLLLGQAITSSNEPENSQLLNQALRELILHEVGHTLGLNHNMKASILWNEKDIHDASKTQGIITGSVMDYAPINVAPNGIKQGDYYQHKPGPYDDWAIEYGYSTGLEDQTKEAERLEKILSRSNEHGLAFGNDADDMRAPGRHIDPRIMIDDMSSNPVAYATDRMDLINHLFSQLKDKTLVKGQSHHALLVSANSLFGQYRGQASVISRQLAGVYIERDVVGSDSKKMPYTPVPKAIQQHAIKSLAKYVFAGDTLSSMAPLYNYLQHQRRGFSHYEKNEDPKPHAMILGMQKSVLGHLLHPNVLKRISDTALYGNTYQLNEVLNDISQAIFSGQTSISHNLQVEYVNRLIAISGVKGASKYDNLSKSQALAQLERIKEKVGGFAFGQDDTQAAHERYLNLIISKAIKRR